MNFLRLFLLFVCPESISRKRLGLSYLSIGSDIKCRGNIGDIDSSVMWRRFMHRAYTPPLSLITHLHSPKRWTHLPLLNTTQFTQGKEASTQSFRFTTTVPDIRYLQQAFWLIRNPHILLQIQPDILPPRPKKATQIKS
ncbi:uncharacterized protein BDR25DRAFT_18120 [Lindgomyces ingoldianus]|uniref:Uncharacterized protein n=1 Tax=Lindgomyces ingoldianus TaxID=673940 RepID=A0ACB6QZ74_9PLEO|nr:uncharacterized protein BDR25DRAFT_18120 [Lindgomyces ingoldianus]KAF2472082.1 hypothetical protein BDR25DRAFT_18120 [Lindgomyces ingoldianus]